MNSFFPILLFFLAALPAGARSISFRVGYICDGPHYYYSRCWDQFRKELARLGGDDFNFSYPEQFQFIDHFHPEEIEKHCRKLLASPQVDLIVGMGLDTAAFFTAQTQLPKPVVLYGALDIELAGLETVAGTSPIPNLTFQVQRDKIPRELARIKQLAREKTVTVLIDRCLLREIDGLEKKAGLLAGPFDLPFRFAYYGATVEETLAQLPPDTAFIYLTPSHALNTPRQVKDLLDGINRRKIPTFAMSGVPVVELGALAGLYRSRVEKIARNNALKVYEIVKGTPPEKLSVYYRGKEDFTINLATARRIGYSPGFDLLMEARLINEEVEEGPLITLRQAVIRARRDNLSYQIAQREAEEEEQAYRQVLSQLFPQLEASASYQRVDSDRAKASVGIQPRWESEAGLQLDQLLFDYSVWKSVALARREVLAAEEKLRRAELEMTENVLLAYLGVLQAREMVRIQRENLTGIRHHRETAQVLLEQEMGSREEVLRWESEYQQALADLIEADMRLSRVSLVFNETMNRPQEASFRLERFTSAAEQKFTAFSGPWLDRVISNREQSDRCRTFLVEAGEKFSPEIALARLRVEMAEQDLARARARLWSPTVGARLNYARRLGEEVWDGVDDSWGRGGPYPDDNEWSAVGYISLPLWKGGGNWADLARKKIARRKAELVLNRQEQEIALSIRAAFYHLAASSTNQQVEEKREQLSRQTLALVEGKYQKGRLPIIDLLDVQSNYISSQASAVSAFYQSLSDLVKLQRAVGFFEWLRTPEEIQDFTGKLQDYVNAPPR